MASMNEVMRILGRLEEGQERMTADIEASSASRGRMHEKLDKLEETVSIVGQVAAQSRNEAAEVRRIIDEDVKPATDDYKRVRAIGHGTLWAVGIAAAGAGVTLATVGEQVVNAVRAWLRIH